MAQDDVNKNTILLRYEEYENNFEEDGLSYKVCMDIKLFEAWGTISHQMLHSKKWLLGFPYWILFFFLFLKSHQIFWKYMLWIDYQIYGIELSLCN